MAITKVRDTGKIQYGGGGTSTTGSFAALPAAGNFVAVLASIYNEATQTVTVTDNQGVGNSYSTAASGSGDLGGAVVKAVIAYDESIGATSGTFTFTISTAPVSNLYAAWIGVEFSGLAGSSSLDKTNTGNDINVKTTDVSVAAVATTSQADELVLAVMVAATGLSSSNIAQPAGYTSLYIEQDSPTYIGGAGCYQILSATGTPSAAWTHDNNAADAPGAAAIATFKAASTVTSGAGNISGIATVTGTGASTVSAAGSVTATATVTGVGASTASGSFDADATAAEGGVGGVLTMVGDGLATIQGAGSITATGTVVGVGASTAGVAGSIASTATVTGTGQSTAAGDFYSQGVLTMTGEDGSSGGLAPTEADGSITAAATVTGTGASIVSAAGSIDIVATATGTGAAQVVADGDIEIVLDMVGSSESSTSSTTPGGKRPKKREDNFEEELVLMLLPHLNDLNPARF